MGDKGKSKGKERKGKGKDDESSSTGEVIDGNTNAPLVPAGAAGSHQFTSPMDNDIWLIAHGYSPNGTPAERIDDGLVDDGSLGEATELALSDVLDQATDQVDQLLVFAAFCRKPAEASVEPAGEPGYWSGRTPSPSQTYSDEEEEDDTGRTPSPSQTLVADLDAEVHSPAIDLDVEVHTPATDLDAEAHTPTIDMLAEVHTPTNDQACLH